MKIKDGFTLKNIHGQQVIVASGEALKGYTSSIVLQETAAFLWKCLENGEMNKEQLVHALLDNFDISKTHKDSLKSSVATIVASANTTQEVVDALEDFIDNPGDGSMGSIVMRE